MISQKIDFVMQCRKKRSIHVALVPYKFVYLTLFHTTLSVRHTKCINFSVVGFCISLL